MGLAKGAVLGGGPGMPEGVARAGSMSAASLFDLHSPGVPCYNVVESQPKKDQRSNGGDVAIKKAAAPRPRGPVKPQGEDGRSNRTIFVGNLPVHCTKKHIKQLFRQYGSVETVRLRSIKVSPGEVSARRAIRTQKQLVEGSSFNAYVVLSSPSEAESCLGLNGSCLQGRHLRVDMLIRKEEKSIQKSVFVGNLPFSADEEKLRQVFDICGQIENIRIVRDPKSGIGKGFGFITFVNTSGVMFALKQNKKATLSSRTLRVCRSKDQNTLQKEKQTKFGGVKYTFKPATSTGKRNPDGTKNRYRSRSQPVEEGKETSRDYKKVGKRSIFGVENGEESAGKPKPFCGNVYGKRPDGTKNRHHRPPRSRS